MEANREGLVNGLYISWNLGMWWAGLIFASAFFADMHTYMLNDGKRQRPQLCVMCSRASQLQEMTGSS